MCDQGGGSTDMYDQVVAVLVGVIRWWQYW